MGDYYIKALGLPGEDQLSRFKMSSSEDYALQNFIRKTARHSSNARLTKTYVAKREGHNAVCGYITIMCAEIRLEQTYSIADKTDADRWDYQPALRVARLAVTDECRGKGIGQQLLDVAVGVALTQVIPHVGCRFMILDAKRKSIEFYSKYGFSLLATDSNIEAVTPIMFLDLRPLA